MLLTVPHISQPLRIWERLEIIISDGKRQGVYVARIVDFTAEGIVITNPDLIKGSKTITNEGRVRVLVTKDDAVYEFSSMMTKMPTKLLDQYILSLPTNIVRVQRRQFVRIDHMEKIEIAKTDKVEENYEIEWLSAQILNFSGGGMLISSEVEIRKGDVILIKTELFEKLDINQPLLAFCCRAFQKDNKHYYGLEFILNDRIKEYVSSDIIDHFPESVRCFSLDTRESIVCFIFKEQLELRKKGLL